MKREARAGSAGGKAARRLDQGLFQLTLPFKTSGWIAWGLAIVLYAIAALFYLYSLGLLKVPPTSEVPTYTHPSAAPEDGFVLIDVILTDGVFVTGKCVYHESDNGSYWDDENYAQRSAVVTARPALGGESFSMRWHGRLSPEINPMPRGCPGTNDWELSGAGGTQMQVLGVWEGGEVQAIGIGEGTRTPPEITQREDWQRGALGVAAVGSLLLMAATPTSLAHGVARMRREWPNHRFVEWSGRKVVDLDGDGVADVAVPPPSEAQGPLRQVDDCDWVFPPPPVEAWNFADPYQPDEGEAIITGHPTQVGTPIPATSTLYSLNAILFFGFLVWMISDLLMRHGSGSHRFWGGLLRLVLVATAALWMVGSFRAWKKVQNIRDAPTGLVRSMAVGPVELVGQVRPTPQGSTTVEVGHSAKRCVGGVARWRWTYEEYDRGGKRSSWVTREEKSGGVPFLLHDGTGGVRVEPHTFAQVERGPPQHPGQRGNHRWTVWCLGMGDPVYLLGTAESRPAEEVRAEGSDPSLPNTLLVVRGKAAPGFHPTLRRGTELTVLAGLRSNAELLVVPALLLLGSFIPFLW